MLPYQQLYNGLVRSADYSIFGREWTRLPAGVHVGTWHRNGLARMDSVLAYGQRGWSMAMFHGTDIGTDNGTDKVKT